MHQGKQGVIRKAFAFLRGFLRRLLRKTVESEFEASEKLSLSSVIDLSWLRCSIYKDNVKRWQASSRNFNVILNQAFTLSTTTPDEMQLIRSTLIGDKRSPFYNEQRLQILGSILEEAILTGDTTCLLYQLHDACSYCVARHKEVFERIVSPISPHSTDSSRIIKEAVAHFMDDFKRDALTSAFINPIRFIYKNSPEMLDNLESHGRSFWSSLMEVVTGISMPYEDISAVDVGWAWGARDFLKIMLKYPHLDKAIRSVIWNPSNFGTSEISGKVGVKFSTMSYFFGFVKSGSPSEFRNFLEAAKTRQLPGQYTEQIHEYSKIFNCYFQDRELINRRLFEYFIRRPEILSAAASVGIPLTAAVLHAHDAGQIKYDFQPLARLLEIFEIQLFT